MRILLVNKFYKRSGGDCIHFRALVELLSDNGCEVAVLTMRHPQNEGLPPGSFEVPGVDINGSLTDKARAATRILGGAGVRASVRDAIAVFRPDVVHIHNIHSYLSPAVAEEAYKLGLPVVWTLHDYKLICGAYTCLQNEQPCTECINKPTAILRHKCMKDSALGSILAFAEAKKWNREKLTRLTSVFICPSAFIRDHMIQAGFPADKMYVLPNFLPISPEYVERERSGVCYVGRLSPEKGLTYLLEAAEQGGWQLTVAGTGPLGNQLKELFAHCANIRFVGHLDSAGVTRLLSASALSVIPSVWYENNPLAAIESLCLGTPIAASAIGGLPELINGTNGVLFEPCDSAAINAAVQSMLAANYSHRQIAEAANRIFSPVTYLANLNSIYLSVQKKLKG